HPDSKTTTATATASTTSSPAAHAAPPEVSVVLPANAVLMAYVEASMAALDAVEAQLAVPAPVLTSTQKRRAAKLRLGGDKTAEQIGALAAGHGAEMGTLRVDDMLLALENARTLAPFLVRIQSFAKHVADLVFLWESKTWFDAMQFYAILQRRAQADGTLAV